MIDTNIIGPDSSLIIIIVPFSNTSVSYTLFYLLFSTWAANVQFQMYALCSYVLKKIGIHSVFSEVLDSKFYVIGFQYLVEVENGNHNDFMPVEVGLVEWSMREGITNTLHTFINPGNDS